MQSTEWTNLIIFSFFIIAAWLRPLNNRARIAISALGAIGISAIMAVQFAAPFFSPITFSVIRDWLPAPLMPMVYWQAGRFSDKPNQNFQNLLCRLDQKVLGTLLRRLAISRTYQWVTAVLELAYLSCYELVPLGLGALYLTGMRVHATEYWFVVLAATYPCYVFTAFVPTLPPRVLEIDSGRPCRGRIRQLNLWIVRHISIGLNTFPSAHVTATLGGSLVVLWYAPAIGFAFLLASIGIAFGAVTGRYHYAADVIVAAALTLAIFVLELLFS